MTMTLSFRENFEFTESADRFEPRNIVEPKMDIHLFADKLEIPKLQNYIYRPRLNDLLAKSSKQFGATLICGRAGTGKSALAADFAARYKNVGWYSVEAPDADWNTFSNYLNAAVFGTRENSCASETVSEYSEAEIARFLGAFLFKIGKEYRRKRLLLVLDDIHHIFDAPWFDLFFTALLNPALPNVHLLMLSRSKPSYPLWRMRSKQVLNYIDEKLLALNLEETVELFKKFDLSKEKAEKAHRESFGRISKLLLSMGSADMQ